MIKKILIEEKDLDSLSSRIPSIQKPSFKYDYKNVVVNKPWGYEYLMFENEQVAVWVLFMKKGSKTSMHCHPQKNTSLLVLDGRAKTSSLNDEFELSFLDSMIISKGVFHSTSTECEDGAVIMEIETPPDKTDLVRLKDEYGRENKGYEGENNISRDLEQYEHHSFHDDIEDYRKITEKALKNSKVLLHSNENWDKLYSEIKDKKNFIVSFLDTCILDQNDNIVLEIGEVCDGEWLVKEFEKLKTNKEIFNLLIIN